MNGLRIARLLAAGWMMIQGADTSLAETLYYQCTAINSKTRVSAGPSANVTVMSDEVLEYYRVPRLLGPQGPRLSTRSKFEILLPREGTEQSRQRLMRKFDENSGGYICAREFQGKYYSSVGFGKTLEEARVSTSLRTLVSDVNPVPSDPSKLFQEPEAPTRLFPESETAAQPAQLKLTGRGFFEPRSETALALACVGQPVAPGSAELDCDLVRFVFFTPSRRAYWLGDVLMPYPDVDYNDLLLSVTSKLTLTQWLGLQEPLHRALTDRRDWNWAASGVTVDQGRYTSMVQKIVCGGISGIMEVIFPSGLGWRKVPKGSIERYCSDSDYWYRPEFFLERVIEKTAR